MGFGCRTNRPLGLGFHRDPKLSLRLPVPQFSSMQPVSCGSRMLPSLMDTNCSEPVPGVLLEQAFSLLWALLRWCL